jgi:hypothetical protein
METLLFLETFQEETFR